MNRRATSIEVSAAHLSRETFNKLVILKLWIREKEIHKKIYDFHNISGMVKLIPNDINVAFRKHSFWNRSFS